MNQKDFQSLLQRVPNTADDADCFQIQVQAPVQFPIKTNSSLFRDRPQQQGKSDFKVVSPLLPARKNPIEPLSYLLAKAKKEQQIKDKLQFERLFYGPKKEHKQPYVKKQKLKNLERYKQLNEEVPKLKSRLSTEEEQRIKKNKLWLKKAKEAAEVIERPADNKITKLEFQNLEARELAITNEYIQSQQTNCSSLLRMILEQDFSSQFIQSEKKKVPQRFSNYEEYLRIFEFLIVNETIASLHNSYRGFKNSEHYKNPIKVNMSFANTNGHGFQILEMEEEREDVQTIPHTLKNLVLSKFNLVLVSSSPHPDLRSISTTRFDKGFLFLGCLVTPESKEELVQNVKVQTMVDKRGMQSAFGQRSVRGYVMFFDKISTFIRQFLAIRHVQFDDLSEFIYNPSLMVKFKNYVCQPEVFEGFFQELENNYNKTQLSSIKELCLRDRGIIMLQGPPGTGKTSTLLGVLSGQYHYIKSQNRLGHSKILVCTPSNTAVDHIVKRIVKEGLIGPNKKIIRPIILRTGVVQTRDPDIRSVYLDDLCEKQVLGTNKQKEDIKMTIFELNEKIKSMFKETRKLEIQYRIDRNQELYARLRSRIAERQVLEHKAYELRKERIDQKSRMNEVQKRLIAGAEILFTTLSSTGTDRIASLKGKFNCLIVDQAGQCTQPNLMIALQLNVPKVLLIGDPCQLPATTFSPDSNVTLYNRSLFQRMIDGGLKPYFLDIQYRMCPQIRQFPSSTFYADRLKDAPTIGTRKYPSSIKRAFKHNNVWFIDVKYGREEFKDKSYRNQAEVEVVRRICERQELQGLSIGIITPYTMQKNALKQALSRDIFVNTIDSFQGQEKDVIIISCVRSAGEDNNKVSVGFLVDQRRINVALTRSRFLLIVVGNAYTLGSNQIWRKFLQYTVSNKGYMAIHDQQTRVSKISRMMENRLSSEDLQCEYQWKQHRNLSRDARKAERQAITLQDFQDGQVVAQAQEQKAIQKQPPKDNQEVQVQPGQEWDVKAAMESTQQKLKNTYGSSSFMDLLNSF